MDKLKDELVPQFLEILEFQWQSVSFTDVFSDSALTEFIEAAVDVSSPAKILRYFPDFFVLHPDLPPEAGALFITCVPTGWVLPKAQIECYQKHFPNRILMIARAAGRQGLVGEWFRANDWAQGRLARPPRAALAVLDRDLGLHPTKAQMQSLRDVGLNA
jgi:hypothetical protein